MKSSMITGRVHVLAVMTMLMAGVANASVQPKVSGVHVSSRLGTIDSATLQTFIQDFKRAAVIDAEQKCQSKVRQLTLFKTEDHAGQYAATHTYTVSAQFECTSASTSDLLMTDANQYLDQSAAEEKTDSSYRVGTVRHFVSFRFNSKVTEKQIEEVKKRFVDLKKLCVRKGKSYISSITFGDANSFEGADQGMTIGFIVTFKSEGDRNFYVGQPLINSKHTELYDPAHVAFKNFVGPLLTAQGGAFVFDFTQEK